MENMKRAYIVAKQELQEKFNIRVFNINNKINLHDK